MTITWSNPQDVYYSLTVTGPSGAIIHSVGYADALGNVVVPGTNVSEYTVSISAYNDEYKEYGKSVIRTVSPGVIYVDPTRATDGGGSCWDDAANDIQNAINTASVWTLDPLAEVRLCQGTFAPLYDPSGNVTMDSASRTFVPKQYVKLVGGYDKTSNTVAGKSTLTGFQGVGHDRSNNVMVMSSFSGVGALFENLIIRDGGGDGAGKAGGAANIFDIDADIEFNNCDFLNNIATASGGAVFIVSSPQITFNDCLFEGNSAVTNGGAIFTSNALTIESCVFRLNHSGEYGGAIYENGSIDLTECEFIENSATSVDSRGGAIYSSGNVAATDCTFRLNTVATAGSAGAIYFDSTTANYVLRQCVFEQNGVSISAGVETINADAGGALMIENFTSFLIERCVFYGNKAQDRGGAIVLTNTVAGRFLSLVNSVFYNNESPGSGSDIYEVTATTGSGIHIRAVFCNFVSTYATTFDGIIKCVTLGPAPGSNTFLGCVFSKTGSAMFVDNTSVSDYYSYCLSSHAFNASNFEINIQDECQYINSNLIFNVADPTGLDNNWMTADDGLRLSNNIEVGAIDIIPSPVTVNTVVYDLTNLPYNIDIANLARPNGARRDPGAYEVYP